MSKPTFYEFFAGAGMARAGLGKDWQCVFANDFDRKKGVTYQENWGKGEIFVDNIRALGIDQLPGAADLAWGSFPCQDLSLAGGGAGLKGERSGTFFPFWDIMSALQADGRAPKIISLENVTGALTSHGGADFQAICQTFHEHGYRYGAVVVDAALFVPQSRPRLFVIGVRNDIEINPSLLSRGPSLPYHTKGLQHAVSKLGPEEKQGLVWWYLPSVPMRTQTFADIIEEAPTSVEWHTPEQTLNLLASMSPINLAKVEAAKRSGRRIVGGIYKRTRLVADGRSVQAEVRFDDVAGCLRTPAGGSSRQTIIVIDGDSVRSRLISSRETARLMGMPDTYVLPSGYNEAYHLMGDGVAVPVVRFIAEHLLEPLAGVISADDSSAETYAA